ncbi:hypothetical protein Tco_1078507 [Tanacetum coccineum]|uniref:Reverse transcriptase domain-containing protein n=1 Tax=Tanacetum coccineum TaxID=301880 RepID=A0ABQ5HQN8_9ASTR
MTSRPRTRIPSRPRLEVMAALVISISSDSSNESVGSSIPRFILIGSIPIEVPVVPTNLPVAPEVGAADVALPAGVLELDTHSSSEFGPSEGSQPPVPVAHMVSPFLCSDDSKSETKLPERHVSSAPHDAMVSRWRSRVASRPYSPSGSLSPTTTTEILTAPIQPAPPAIVAPSTDIISPIVASPRVRRRQAILIRSGQEIPVGQLYRTYPGRPCGALTARNSIESLPSHRLELRYTSHHLDRFTSGSSSDHSSSDHSLADHSLADHTSGHSTSDQSLSRRSSPSLPLDMRPRLWIRSPMSSTRFSSTIESSPSDSPATTLDRHSHSPSHSAGPSRKRCRSLVATVSSSIPYSGALVRTRVDLLPPRKRFRDSYSPDDSVEEDIDADVLADINADAVAIKVAADMDVETGVDAGIGIEVQDNIEDEDEGKAKSSDRGTIEVGVYVVAGIDIPDGMLMPDVVEHLEQLEAESLIASGERAGFLDCVAALERSNARLQDTLRMESMRANRLQRHMGFMEDELSNYISYQISSCAMSCVEHDYHSLWYDPEAIEELIAQRVVEALATYEANHVAELVVESQIQNGDDGDNGNDGGNGDRNRGGNGNGNGGGNGNGNTNRNDRGVLPVTRECTYHDFVKCQPLNFKGTEGVVRLTRWFEKIETVFHINNCLEKYQVKYATRPLLNNALTWWNSYKRTIGADVGNDLTAYTQRFQELTMLCTKMVPKEEDRVEKFIRGLPNNIQGNVITAEPMRLQDAIQIANNLMDQKLKGYAAKSMENKRRLYFNQKDNRAQQPPYKRQNVGGQNVARAYTVGNNERKGYARPWTYCNKCNLQHEGQCTVRCSNCKKVRHLTRDCKATVAITT